MKNLQKLEQHVEQLCKDVLTPLSTIDRDITLIPDFEDDIKTFVKYAEFQHVIHFTYPHNMPT